MAITLVALGYIVPLRSASFKFMNNHYKWWAKNLSCWLNYYGKLVAIVRYENQRNVIFRITNVRRTVTVTSMRY